MGSWKRLYLVLLTASVTIMAITCDKEFTLQRKVPLKFLKAILDTSSLCEAGYLDDENCENVIPWEERKSETPSIQYVSNVDEPDYEKAVSGDFTITVEKRGHHRGCNCQHSSSIIDLGPKMFPRHIRNVTCDEHRSCFTPRFRGTRCKPIHYDITVMTMRSEEIDPSQPTQFESLAVPHKLRCCWRAFKLPTVVGCFCSS